MSVGVEYTGKFPRLCEGHLIVVIDGKRWIFGAGALDSGGSIRKDGDTWIVTRGPWEVGEWPTGFPEEHKAAAVEAINKQVPQGCCGGCVNNGTD